jgi:hypothetical protein
MYKLTDALALANVISKLDQKLTIETMNRLLPYGSDKMEGSYEAILV